MWSGSESGCRPQSCRKKTPEVIAAIEELMKYEVAGDPVSGLRWTRKTTKKIAAELSALGIRVSRKTVAKLLKQMNFSLRTNKRRSRMALLQLATPSSPTSHSYGSALADVATPY